MKHCYLTPTHNDLNKGYDIVIDNVISNIFDYDDAIYALEQGSPEYYRLIYEYITAKSFPLIVACKDYDHLHFRKIARFSTTANQTWSVVSLDGVSYDITELMGGIGNNFMIVECGKPLKLYTRTYLGTTLYPENFKERVTVTVTMGGQDVSGRYHKFERYAPLLFQREYVASTIYIPCVTGDIDVTVLLNS